MFSKLKKLLVGAYTEDELRTTIESAIVLSIAEGANTPGLLLAIKNHSEIYREWKSQLDGLLSEIPTDQGRMSQVLKARSLLITNLEIVDRYTPLLSDEHTEEERKLITSKLQMAIDEVLDTETLYNTMALANANLWALMILLKHIDTEDPDDWIIPLRKMHTLLVRLRYRAFIEHEDRTQSNQAHISSSAIIASQTTKLYDLMKEQLTGTSGSR